MSFLRNVAWYIKGSREFTMGGYEKASRAFRPQDLVVDVKERSFMVTGANSGLGLGLSHSLARMGGTVHMVCRNAQRGEEALKEVIRVSGNQNVFLHELDISKPRDVVAFAQAFEQSGKPLNVLINNAGVLLTEKERQFTEDNVEVTFATNTLGTHVMTTSFVPIVSKYTDPRIIIVTSGGMLTQKLNLSDLQFARQSPFDGTMAYAQTKRHQTIMTQQYSKQFPSVYFASMHPGWVDTPGVRTSLPDFYKSQKDKLRTVDQGVDTLLWLAVAKPPLTQASGHFYQDRQPVSDHMFLGNTRSSAQDDKQLMKILDDMAKQLTQ